MTSILSDLQLELRYYIPEDRPYIQGLFTDLAIQQRYQPWLTKPYHPSQLDAVLATWHDGEHHLLFTIKHQSSHEPIGLANLDQIDLYNRHAEIGIGIANEKFRGQGYATAALRLLMQYAHDQMGLQRIYARVIDGNEASKACFEKLGFQLEGIQRKHVYRDGQWLDLYLYGYLY